MIWETLAENLPHCTALLNASATVVLAFGLIKIRQGNVRGHKKMMLTALGISAFFLALYLLHKVALYQVTGEPNKRFPSDVPASARYTYFSILISHLLSCCACCVLPRLGFTSDQWLRASGCVLPSTPVLPTDNAPWLDVTSHLI